MTIRDDMTGQTTGGALGEVETLLEKLIGWAKADVDHSLELALWHRSEDDRVRVRNLTRALELVRASYR